MSTLDAGRDRTPGTWTRVPSSSPGKVLVDSDGITGGGLELVPPSARVQWFFGFPTALVTQRMRHYQWGRWGTKTVFDTAEFGPTRYLRPSTEEFYDGDQTHHPLPFVHLSCASNQYAGITADGRLWTWGIRTVDDGRNALGVGDNNTIAEPFERSTFSSSLGHWRATKFISTTPQPVLGENDALADVSFVKCVVTDSTMLALSSSGNLYVCGNTNSIFGPGDYYTSGSSGRTAFPYPTLVRHWGLSFAMVGSTLVGTPVENAARVWRDFAISRSASDTFIRLIADDGKIYRTGGGSSGMTTEDVQTAVGRPYRLVVTDAGFGYSSTPAVTITASPTGDSMTATASRVGLSVSSLIVSNWGSGYTSVPTITVDEPTATEKLVYPDWRKATVEVQQIIPAGNTWASVYTGVYGSISSSEDGRFAISSDGYLFRINSGTAFARLHDTKQFKKVAVGSAFLVALSTDGEVWTIGTANNGTSSSRATIQLLDAGPWVDIAAGVEHGVMIKANGEAWAWGTNAHGQLGTGNTTSSTTPIKVSGNAKWKALFSSPFATLAIRDEQFDAAGNRVETLAFAG